MKPLKKIISIIFTFCIIFTIQSPIYAADSKMYTTDSAEVYEIGSYGSKNLIQKIEKNTEVTVTDNGVLTQGTYYHISSPINGYINKNKLTTKKPSSSSSSSSSGSNSSSSSSSSGSNSSSSSSSSGSSSSSSDSKGTTMYVIEDSVDEKKWENYSLMNTGKKYNKGDTVKVYGNKKINGKEYYILSPDIYAETYVPTDVLSSDKNDIVYKDEEGNIMKKYYSPGKVGSTDTSTKGIDDMMGDAKDFVSSAKTDVGQVDNVALQSFSSTFYNIFLTAGTAIAVIAGMIIGIKYMLGSVEEKADVKTMLVPYVVGCIVVFGSFGIWKLMIEIMQNI